MDENQNIPLLFSFYFGDSAASAQRGASKRLKKWSRAFEQWMGECNQDYPKDTVQRAVVACRRFVSQCGKMLWEVTREDIEQHTAWMKQQGFAAKTINFTLWAITGFYQWCDAQRVDSACASGFNPAKEAIRNKVSRYEGVSMWSLEEVQAFLSLLNRDGTELGKREYAFFLARLNLGMSLKNLYRLTWGQIEQDEAGAWVRWRQDGERVRLPDPVWQALREYLRASSRLEGMSAGKYIFAPLAYPGREVTGSKAEDWLEQQPLTTRAILNSLKLYGRQVGIVEEKLNLMALRRTAIRLRMDQGESLEGMKIFMDCRDNISQVKYKLGKLPQMAGESTVDVKRQAELPVRKAKPFKQGENTTHGFYTHRKDKQAVQAVVAENIHGMEEETACLRKLMRGLLEREGDEARLVEVYSQAAHRLGDLVSTGEPAQKRKKDPWAEEMLSKLDEIEMRNGRPPISPRVREEALGISSDMLEVTGMLTEEVATIRLLLRDLNRRAMQGIEMREYLRLVDLYGLGCVRLARLLRIGGCDENERLKRYLQAGLDKAIRDVRREWGLDQ